jgi:hypothetical protein
MFERQSVCRATCLALVAIGYQIRENGPLCGALFRRSFIQTLGRKVAEPVSMLPQQHGPQPTLALP